MVPLGIALGTLGSIAINAGNNLQSYGMAQLEAKIHAESLESDEEAKVGEKADGGALAKDGGDGLKEGLGADDGVSPAEIDTCQSTTWIVGTTIFVSGSLLNFAAFAFAPQSVLASLEGIQFVTNVMFGRLVLGKDISTSMYAGTGVVILGVVLTVLSASVVGPLEADFNHLIALWAEPGWIVYLILTGGFGVLLQGTHQVYVKAKANGASLAYSELVLPVSYATFSALFGTLSVVFAKILSELVTLMIEGTPIFWGPYCWFTYVTLIGWLLLVGVWLYRMNEALSLYDPLFIIPLLQMNFILFAIISGGIYFQEFNMFGAWNWAGFVAGVSMLFTGIYLLSPATNGGGGDSAVHPMDPTAGDEASLNAAGAMSSAGPVTPISVEPKAALRRTQSQTPPRPATTGSFRESFREGGGACASPSHHHMVLPYHAMIPPKMRTTQRLTEESTLYRSLSLRLGMDNGGNGGIVLDGRPQTPVSLRGAERGAEPRPSTSPMGVPPKAAAPLMTDLNRKLSAISSGSSEPASPETAAIGVPVTPDAGHKKPAPV